MFSKTLTIIILSFICGIVSIANIFVSAKLSHLGSDVVAIEYQKQALETSISLLKQNIATKTALLEVNRGVEALGFSPVTQVLVLQPGKSVALNRL